MKVLAFRRYDSQLVQIGAEHMKKFNWRKATLGELYEIIHHDHDCPPAYKISARYELRRRFEASKANIRYREKRYRI